MNQPANPFFRKCPTNAHDRPYKKGVRLPEEDIIYILMLHEKKKRINKIAEIVQHDEKTVAKYIKKYEEHRDPFHVNKKELESGVHTAPSRVDYLCSLVMNYPATTLERIRQQYITVFGEISMSMIYYILTRHLKLKWKKTRMVELARATRNMTSLREKFDCFFV